MTLRGIAQALGIGRKTVRRWLRAGHAPTWRHADRGRSSLDPFRDYLEARWAAGYRNGTGLWREIRDRGFAGQSGIVRQWAARRRRQDPSADLTTPPKAQAPTARKAARLLMGEPDKLDEGDRRFVTALLDLSTMGDGVPVACAATAANVNDTLVFERLFLAAFAVMARIRTVFADKGYEAEHHRDLCREFGAEPCIHKRGQPHGSGLGKRRWPVERSNAWVLENKRLALRYDRLGFIIQSLLQAACIFLVAGRVAKEL